MLPIGLCDQEAAREETFLDSTKKEYSSATNLIDEKDFYMFICFDHCTVLEEYVNKGYRLTFLKHGFSPTCRPYLKKSVPAAGGKSLGLRVHGDAL